MTTTAGRRPQLQDLFAKHFVPDKDSRASLTVEKGRDHLFDRTFHY